MKQKALKSKLYFQQNSRLYSLLARLVISTGLITFIILNVNFYEIMHAFGNANLLLFASCLIIMPFNLFLQYMKWKIAANKVLGEITDREIAFSLFLGLSAGAFTPARLGEYWGRSVIIKQSSLIRVTAASIIDKFFPLIIVLSSGLVATLLFFIYRPSADKFQSNESAIYLAIPLIITIAAFVIIFNFKRIIKIFQKLSWAYKHETLFNVLKEINAGFLIRMFLISAVYCTSYIFQYALLASAFSGTYNIGIYIWTGILVMFSKTIFGPFSLSELGIREGASVYFMTAFGESAAVGFNAAIFLFLINVILPSLPGLFLMLKKINGK